MNRLQDTPLLALLPESISHDNSIKAATSAVDPVLRASTLAVPNVLLYARLLHTTEGAMGAVVEGADAVTGNAAYLPALHRLIAARGGLSPLGTAELELLAWQFHVDFREVAKDNSTLARMIVASIPWHRIKGTPASIRAALALFGHKAEIEEHNFGRHWATYQLGLPDIADLDTVRLVYRVAREMAPVRCRLWRMYSGYDRRPVVWSGGTEHDRWSEGWWSYYSGVSVPGITEDGEDDILVSFGLRNAYQADAFTVNSLCCSFGATSILGLLAPYVDRPIWSLSQWSDVYPQNHGFTIGSLFSILWCDRATVARSWQGGWDDRRWLDYIGFDRQLPLWRIGIRNFSKSHAVYSGGNGWDDTNSCYSRPTALILDAPPVWGASKWSEDALVPRQIIVHEQSIVPTGLSVLSLNPASPHSSGHSHLSVAPATPTPRRVQVARHDALSLAGAALSGSFGFAGESHLAACSAPLISPVSPKPTTAVTTLRAPLWQGAWNEAGRTWESTQQLFIQ